ncbi:hypothetical protein [Janthinobacterium psychrotolerans]|uniref:PH domain-containing protein n=1 Tax=Janthinobacterium psychrotolerans TaxID=1747903 RepID=A0A1A7C7T2_9BURK|nr:hypothetical protein [Janthinobacterium psychrotolerans]OBV40825.1 hypothetical protein ASR47_102030 [Janthinobacterium psychrotolerans]
MTDPLALPDSNGPRAVFLCGKSWTAYTGTFFIAVLLFFAALPLAFKYNTRAALIVLAGSALIVGYRLLTIRSYQLYYDEAGVWLASGILPWKKKLTGVPWRDLGQASHETTFWSWLFRSYTVRISMRSTGQTVIHASGMARGKHAVDTIHIRLRELLDSRAVVV